MTRHLLLLPCPYLFAAIAIAAFAACNEELPFPPDDGGTDAVSDSGGDTGTDTGTCSDGETRPAGDGCNTCSCFGGEWMCTLMACPAPECETAADCVVSGCSGQLCGAEPMDSDCAWRPEYACYVGGEFTSCGCFDGRCGWEQTDALEACLDEVVCTPGERREADDGCNTCVCDEGGAWACTEMACPGLCTPGSVGGDCGECVCDRAGEWICSDVECPSCSPGDTRGLCDECVCDESGTWACADVDCGECVPGDTRELDECNSCVCLDGGTWACTGLACPECEVGDERPMDCGSCTCEPPGFWQCVRDPSCGGCRPGATRPADDGCNTCTCTDAGEWACTERACATECDSDDDCIRTGCSGQLCRPEPTASTCEFLPHYACFGDPDVTSCGCRAGVCAWDPTDALSACIADAGAP